MNNRLSSRPFSPRVELPSRSAGVQRAVQMLRWPTLEEDYGEAWQRWSADEHSEAWEGTVGDGVCDAAR
jgi:hypothetical protein